MVSFLLFLFKQKTAYEMLISYWSSDVCASDLSGCSSSFRPVGAPAPGAGPLGRGSPPTPASAGRPWGFFGAAWRTSHAKIFQAQRAPRGSGEEAGKPGQSL